MKQPEGSNIGDLIGYIRYHNCDVQHSAVSSVLIISISSTVKRGWLIYKNAGAFQNMILKI